MPEHNKCIYWSHCSKEDVKDPKDRALSNEHVLPKCLRIPGSKGLTIRKSICKHCNTKIGNFQATCADKSLIGQIHKQFKNHPKVKVVGSSNEVDLNVDPSIDLDVDLYVATFAFHGFIYHQKRYDGKRYDGREPMFDEIRGFISTRGHCTGISPVSKLPPFGFDLPSDYRNKVRCSKNMKCNRREGQCNRGTKRVTECGVAHILSFCKNGTDLVCIIVFYVGTNEELTFFVRLASCDEEIYGQEQICYYPYSDHRLCLPFDDIDVAVV